MTKQQFENKLLNQCNDVANKLIAQARLTGAEVTNEECFEMAKRMVFKTYEKMVEVI